MSVKMKKNEGLIYDGRRKKTDWVSCQSDFLFLLFKYFNFHVGKHMEMTHHLFFGQNWSNVHGRLVNAKMK